MKAKTRLQIVTKFRTSMLMSCLKVKLGRVVIASAKGVCCKLLVWEKLKPQLVRFQVTFHSSHPTTLFPACLLFSLFLLSSSHTVSHRYSSSRQKSPPKLSLCIPRQALECLQTNIHRLSSENVFLWPSNSRSASHLRRDHFHAQQ